MGTGEFNARDNPAMDWHPIHATETGDKRRPDGLSRLVADFTLNPVATTMLLY